MNARVWRTDYGAARSEESGLTAGSHGECNRLKAAGRRELTKLGRDSLEALRAERQPRRQNLFDGPYREQA